MIIIGKPINGISINGNEWLLTPDGKEEMKFKDADEAKQFLKGNGFDNLSDEALEDSFTFKEV